MIYHIMYRDRPAIDIETDEKRNVIRYEKFIEDSPLQPFCGENINRIRVYNFLKSRCYEDGRAGLKDILAAHGLKNNDPYKWNRISHGVMWEDSFWIRYDDEDITWEDVRAR